MSFEGYFDARSRNNSYDWNVVLAGTGTWKSTTVFGDGQGSYFYNHPNRSHSTAWVLLMGDGTTQLGSLRPSGATQGVVSSELSFDSLATFAFPCITAIKQSNDILRVAAAWPEVPASGTSIALTLPSVSLTVWDGAGTSATISGSHTTSNYDVDDKHVMFYINEVGAFTSLNFGPLILKWGGSGGKLTIS